MKKVVVLFVLAALMISMFAGCLGSEPPAPHTPEPAEDAAPASDAAEDNDADAVTSASPKETSDPAAIVNGLSPSGFWILSILSDVTLPDELVVSGEFHQRDDTDAPIYRKFALYAQDADRNITERYTLTVPRMVVESPNFRIQGGTVAGDVFVNAEGFDLEDATINGNLTFATQAMMDSAKLENGTVSGNISVEGAGGGEESADAVSEATEEEDEEDE